jgi:hypothetical protein
MGEKLEQVGESRSTTQTEHLRGSECHLELITLGQRSSRHQSVSREAPS